MTHRNPMGAGSTLQARIHNLTLLGNFSTLDGPSQDSHRFLKKTGIPKCTVFFVIALLKKSILNQS